MKFTARLMVVLVTVIYCNTVMAARNPYYGKYMRDVFDAMDCGKIGDGLHPSILDIRGFYQCAGGNGYYFECSEGLVFDLGCNCCNWPEEYTEYAVLKRCDTAEYKLGDAFDCRDNPDMSKRGPGNCGCAGVGVSYYGCTATPPCPAIINSAGSDAALRDSYGSCYAPTGIGFGDISGGFEFSENCYYSD